MSGISDSNATDSFDQTLVVVKGGTDNTSIGNVGDRMKVDAFNGSSANLDAFSRLRVSNPFNLFDSTFQFDLSPDLYNTSVLNSGAVTYNSNKKSAILSTAAVSNSTAIIQSFDYFKYHPGRSQFAVISGNFGAAVSGVIKRIGCFDESNGFFLQISSSDISFVIRSSITGAVVDNAVAQASWNINTMLVSPILDITKQQILFFDFQWLGSGRVRFGFVIDGEIKFCHQFTHANIISTLYSQTANLPIRVEIVGNQIASIEFACAGVVCDGAYAPDGILRTINNSSSGGRSISGTTANFPVLSIRKQSAYSVMPIMIKEVQAFVSSSDDVLLKIVKNATLTGASWVNAPTGYAQYDLSATSYTGGSDIYSCYLRGAATVGSVQSIIEIFKDVNNSALGKFINGNSESMTISISNITSSSTIYSVFNYSEIK
ncbi:MAG: hypothetical protein ACP5N7_02020 [Candidatus Pacearchaeota archaeon]